MIQVVRLKHVKRYRVGGKAYWYHRITRERLPDDETQRIARVLQINANLDGWRAGTIPGSIGDVIGRYRASPEFKRLAESTRTGYAAHLDLLERSFAADPITDIDVAWLYEVRDAMGDTPRSADLMLALLSVLLNFAIARGFRQDNPARHVKKLGGGKSYEPWPEVAIERFRAEANPRMVWALELAIHTGQRRGDVLAMRWNHIADGMIAVAQQKTGTRLEIPIHPKLADVLEEIPRVGMTIVHRKDGQPYNGNAFGQAFKREQRRLGLQGLQFHGLRHTAAARLAEAGASDREIMSILGHRTASMVTRYTRAAEQKRLARAAIGKVVKLETKT